MADSTGTIIIPHGHFVPKCHFLLIFLVGLIAFAGFAGCSKERTDYKSYYFPIEQCADGMVYIYDPVDQLGHGREIWFLKSEPSDSGWVLRTRIYDSSKTLVQEVTEMEVGNGTIARSYAFFTRDTADQLVTVPLQIQRANLFPYDIGDTSLLYTFVVSYKEPGDTSLTTTLTRQRRYKGKDEILLPDGAHKSLVFALKEKMENEGVGFLTLEFEGEEVYAKDIGLAAWQKVQAPGDTVAYYLQQRLTLKEFTTQFGILE